MAIYLISTTKQNADSDYYKAFVIDKFGNEWLSIDLGGPFRSKSKIGYCWQKFLHRTKIFDKDSVLLTEDNTLTISFKVFIRKNALKDLEPIYPDLCERKFTDILIKVQNKTIKAHKFILAGASAEFHQKFLNAETLDVLVIDNLDFEVVEKMISFIYDNEVDDMEKYGILLLEAANLVISVT
jgi:hypothetical protein